jgi:hypothetical protein
LSGPLAPEKIGKAVKDMKEKKTTARPLKGKEKR